MPFIKNKKNKRRTCSDESDPELEAEKEYEKEFGTKKPSVSEGAEKGDEAKTEDDAEQEKPVINYKEPKALRKTRSRGVSGSSIKKDGGRFEFGLNNRDDYDDVSDDDLSDIIRYMSKHVGNVVFDSESEDSSASDGGRELPANVTRLQQCLIEAIKDPAAQSTLHSMTEVLTEFFDEKTRLETIAKAMDDMIKRDTWTSSDAVDRMAEYKTVSLLARLIDQGLISVHAFKEHFEHQMWAPLLRKRYRLACSLLRPTCYAYPSTIPARAQLSIHADDSQTSRLMGAAVQFHETKAPELQGDFLAEPPSEFADIALDVCRSGEVSSVRETLRSSPFFHADVVYQVCNAAATTMNMDIIFNAAKAFKDLIAEKIMTRAAVNAGVSRFLTELQDTEVDLPAASSLAFLLVSYCIERPACIDSHVYRKCPRPSKFLRKRTPSSGRLSIREEPEEDCTESNYLDVA